VIVADGDFVIVHGRLSGFGAPLYWIAADIVRIQAGILVEHWDGVHRIGQRSATRGDEGCNSGHAEQ
jgi:predicted SnoaL-like aldol condensation-catalyzing enzyme